MTKEPRFNVHNYTKRAYQAHFGMKMRDQDKPWALHKVCITPKPLRVDPRKSKSNEVWCVYGLSAASKPPRTMLLLHRRPLDMAGWNHHKKKP